MNKPPPSFEEFILNPKDNFADFRTNEDPVPLGDRRDGLFYRYTPKIKLAVRVALAVGRPLLLLGPSGCGKSSLAFNLSRLMRRRYYEFVVQARTQAQELFYRFDAIRRLGEAQASAASKTTDAINWRSCYPFIEPGHLWWVFNPAAAYRRGASAEEAAMFKSPVNPVRWNPGLSPEPVHPEPPASQNDAPAVLLIDEIDKAEPDFPNNLLVPLGSQEFTIEETGDVISFNSTDNNFAPAPLIIITSNQERDLPNAFIRRCIVLEIKPPTTDELVELAKSAFCQTDHTAHDRFTSIANKMITTRPDSPLSTAEFLDVVRAITSLKVEDGDWEEIILRTTWKASDTVGQ
ncbi:MAG TPA: hypothetical protein DCQ92_16475 [Verrucomicrobia subdivision 3 bacterium]|nr:hypothetical protein [Limisphaerales bacterium]